MKSCDFNKTIYPISTRTVSKKLNSKDFWHNIDSFYLFGFCNFEKTTTSKHGVIFTKLEKQKPPEVFRKKNGLIKFCKIHRKTPVPESFFNKVAGLRPFVNKFAGVFLWVLRNF